MVAFQWSTNYQEHQITIIYDTMWQSTRRMAQAIADGIRDFDPTVRVVLMNAAKDDKNDILVEVFRSKAIMVGSPTVNMGITYAIAGLLEMIHGMKCKNKKVALAPRLGRRWREAHPAAIGGSGLRDCRRTGQAALGSRHGG